MLVNLYITGFIGFSGFIGFTGFIGFKDFTGFIGFTCFLCFTGSLGWRELYSLLFLALPLHMRNLHKLKVPGFPRYNL